MTTPDTNESPPWGRSVKITVAVSSILLLAVALVTFRSLIRQLILAAILAYVLGPVIRLIDERTPLKRSHGILLVYLLVFAGLGGGITVLGVTIFNQVNNVAQAFPGWIRTLATLLASLSEQQFAVGPWTFDFPQIDLVEIEWQRLAQELIGLAQPVLSRSTDVLGRVVTGSLSTISTLLFVLVLSIYISVDFPRMGGMVADVAHVPGYRRDAERLTRDFGRIWSAYLRGQIILGVVIGIVVWLSLSIMGVQNAGVLGLLSGLLEFLPIIGPVIGAGVAMLVALFQTTPTWMGLETWQLALAVLAVMFLIQQLENNILVPRIVGEALDLHPLVVMVGVIMGSTVAGILGAVLAAPVLATIKLVGSYAWRKMFDLPPFPRPEPEAAIAGDSFLGRLRARVRDALSAAPPAAPGDGGEPLFQPAVLREAQPPDAGEAVADSAESPPETG